MLDLPTHPPLARRGEDGRRLLLDEIDRIGARVVVNCCGRLRGSEDEMVDANVTWPAWLVEVLRDTGVRLVHMGSASEYGDPGSSAPIPETATPRPSGLYGETKWSGSRTVLGARSAGMDAVVARGFNFVSRDLPEVSPLFEFRAAVEALPPAGGEVELWWPGTVRDFIALDDMGEAVARLALAPEVPDIVNVCSGVGVSFADVVRALGAATGREVRIRSLDRPGIPAVVGDPARLRSVTGLSPAMSAERIAELVCGPPRAGRN